MATEDRTGRFLRERESQALEELDELVEAARRDLDAMAEHLRMPNYDGASERVDSIVGLAAHMRRELDKAQGR